MQPFGISFYSVKGGYEDEWLELYMQWHYPLMEYALEHGTLLEHKLFVPAVHGIEAQWTFAVSFLYAAAADSTYKGPLCQERDRRSEHVDPITEWGRYSFNTLPKECPHQAIGSICPL
jgi:hypothetical protein